MKLNNQKINIQDSLLTIIVDQLNLLMWQRSGRKGGKPKSIYKLITDPPKPKDELKSFSTPEDFNEWYRKKQERYKNG